MRAVSHPLRCCAVAHCHSYLADTSSVCTGACGSEDGPELAAYAMALCECEVDFLNGEDLDSVSDSICSGSGECYDAVYDYFYFVHNEEAEAMINEEFGCDGDDEGEEVTPRLIARPEGKFVTRPQGGVFTDDDRKALEEAMEAGFEAKLPNTRADVNITNVTDNSGGAVTGDAGRRLDDSADGTFVVDFVALLTTIDTTNFEEYSEDIEEALIEELLKNTTGASNLQVLVTCHTHFTPHATRRTTAANSLLLLPAPSVVRSLPLSLPPTRRTLWMRHSQKTTSRPWRLSSICLKSWSKIP